MAAFDAAIEFLQGVQTEILLFVLAGLLHSVLFKKRRINAARAKPKLSPSSASPPEAPAPSPASSAAQQNSQGARLLRAVRPLLRDEASLEQLEDTMKLQLVKCSNATAEVALVGLLDGVCRVATADLLAALRNVTHSRGLCTSGRLGEQVLKICLDLHLNSEFEAVLAEVQSSPAGESMQVSILALRAAITTGDIEASLSRLQVLGKAWQKSLATTPSHAPQQCMQQLCQLALSRSRFPELLRGLQSGGLLAAWSVEALLRESARLGHVAALRSTWALAHLENVQLTAAAQCYLVRGLDSAEEVLRCLSTATASAAPGKELLLAAAEAAARLPSKALAEEVLARLPAAAPDAEVLAGVLHLAKGVLAGEDANASVVQIYEKHCDGVDILSDASAARLVAEAAIAQQRPDLLKRLLSLSPEGPKQISMLKSFGAEMRLQDALKVFRACAERTTCVYNAMLDACIECKDVAAAQQIMVEASQNGLADVITYNTIIKAYLQVGNLEKARRTMVGMRAAGFAPNCVTFNELIDASIRVSSSSSSIWLLIEEMEACGLKPSQVTCSILLKSIRHAGQGADLERTLKMLGDQMEEDMDEVLLSSVCEACIRANRPDLLQSQLQRQRSSKAVQVRGAHTVGSIIRGFGFIHDVEGVWATWKAMRSRKILPTSITMGCMVEAVVNNEGPEAGYRVIQEMFADEETRPLLNAVIYCSVLKGFSHQKQFSKVWELYEEMLAQKLQFSIVTFNTLVDACARSCEMSRVPRLLSEMVSQKIDPNVITYSTILKGYCQEQKMEKAFELWEEMKRSRTFQPDEITYNTLLDGCARRGLYDKGVSLLWEMEQAGVKPSNFTLSVVVKLAKRSHDPDKAFELCEQLSRKHRLRLNVHVYNNLMHACALHGDNRRALEVLKRMLGERVKPDQRTYLVLLRGFIAGGQPREAAGVLRAAVGLKQPHPALAKFDAALLQPRGGLSSEALSEVLEGMSSPGGDDVLAAELLGELRTAPGVKIDSKMLVRLCSSAAGGSSP